MVARTTYVDFSDSDPETMPNLAAIHQARVDYRKREAALVKSAEYLEEWKE